MSECQTAFCPGHITAFFEICDEAEDPLRRGSRGAGMSISLGATSTVSVSENPTQEISIRLDGKEDPAVTTRTAIERIIGEEKLKIVVDTAHDLPIGQGFAMSAAGALSASLALCSLRGIERQKAFEAAHLAEISNGTGLGDIAGVYAGGVETRLEPGLPPFGKVERTEIESDIVICVLGEPKRTVDVLSHRETRELISSAGRKCLQEFIEHRTLEHMFALGMEFLEDSGLFVSREVLEGLVIAEQNGMASMAMLGNSIFCAGDIDELVTALRPMGKTLTCEIDDDGPRLL